MDEEDILQECKSQNSKLIELWVSTFKIFYKLYRFAKRFLLISYLQVYFFASVTKPENMEEMVKLITVEPTDSDDEKLRYK